MCVCEYPGSHISTESKSRESARSSVVLFQRLEQGPVITLKKMRGSCAKKRKTVKRVKHVEFECEEQNGRRKRQIKM